MPRMKLRNLLLLTAAIAGVEIVGVVVAVSVWFIMATDIIQ